MADEADQFDRAAVFFAMKEISAHPAVSRMDAPEFTARGAALTVELDLRLGSRWKAQGKSPTGVLPTEEIRFDFPPAFPAQPPEVSLRPDFDRNHPHIQPWLTAQKRVVPCLVDGSIGEFIAARGFHDLVEQAELWLVRAANGDLIDREQGWEPTRRDSYRDILVADADQLRGFVDRSGGYKFLTVKYGYEPADGLTPFFLGALGEETNAKAPICQSPFRSDSQAGQGEGIVIVAWPGKRPNGKPIIANKYLSDDIAMAAELWERMEAFGTAQHVRDAIGLLNRRAGSQEVAVFPLAIVNLVRRPCRLIGTQSDVEICGYVVPLHSLNGALAASDDPIRPLSHRDAIHPALLRRMSGDPEIANWALLGCGSLGSKIAVHATRSGNAPSFVADKTSLSPHNAARHALIPSNSDIQIGWLSPKAEALAEALNALGGQAKPVVGDHVVLANVLAAIKAKKARPRWLLNTTASMVAQEALARMSMRELPRIIEMALYDGGALGYVGIEGEGHNPNALELEASLFQHATTSKPLSQHLFTPTGGASQISIGQGCGSLTMRMSDATLSVMAGTMAEIFTGLGCAEPGAIHLLRRSGFATEHERVEVPAFHRVALEGLDGWTISLAENVHRRITEEVGRYPKVETGGVLIGWSSLIARQLIVTDLIEAPEDSIRSRSEFVLGVKGLGVALAGVDGRSGGLLRCLGTWHSHLGTAQPSRVDTRSAALAGAGDARPMAFLIIGSEGYRAICVPAMLVKADQPEIPARSA